MSSEPTKNTIQSICTKINAFAGQFTIVDEQVTVTSYRQEGDKVRVFFTINNTYGLSEEEKLKVKQPITNTFRIIPDPFAGEDPETPSVPGPAILVTSITVPPVGEMTVGDTLPFLASVLPNNATDKTYNVVSANPSIVQVINSGANIVAVGVGTINLTVTARDGSGISTTVQVRVVAAIVPATSIVATPSSGDNLVIDEVVTFTTVVNPSNATDKTWTVESSDGTILQVIGNTVKALTPGVATVTIRANGAAVGSTVTDEHTFIVELP